MAATQQMVPIREFAQAMLEADSDFAARVQRFADRFGAVDADGLAVLAQARAGGYTARAAFAG